MSRDICQNLGVSLEPKWPQYYNVTHGQNGRWPGQVVSRQSLNGPDKWLAHGGPDKWLAGGGLDKWLVDGGPDKWSADKWLADGGPDKWLADGGPDKWLADGGLDTWSVDTCTYKVNMCPGKGDLVT